MHQQRNLHHTALLAPRHDTLSAQCLSATLACLWGMYEPTSLGLIPGQNSKACDLCRVALSTFTYAPNTWEQARMASQIVRKYQFVQSFHAELQQRLHFSVLLITQGPGHFGHSVHDKHEPDGVEHQQMPQRHANTMWRKLLYSGFETCFGPSTQGAGTKTHLKSRFCLQAILKKRGVV